MCCLVYIFEPYCSFESDAFLITNSLILFLAQSLLHQRGEMSKRHFTVTTFLERLNELDCRPRTPGRMNSAGRQRANNSLPGIDFSNHTAVHASQVRKSSEITGERRHMSPSGFQHFRNLENVEDGPLEVKPHGIRIVRQASATNMHIDGTMTSTVTSATRASKGTFSHRSSSADSDPLLTRDRGCVSPTPLRYRSAKRLGDSPRECLTATLVPREIAFTPRPIPEPMVLKEYRRSRRYAGDPSTPLHGREEIFPNFGHRAMLGEPKHFVHCVPKKGSTYVPVDNLGVGSVIPVISPDRYVPLAVRLQSPSRSYDVVTLLGNKSSPSRSRSISGTPLRHSEMKNRSSSPNILAWV